MVHEPRHVRAGSLLALAAIVLLWRVAAAASPYREGVLATMTEDSLGIRWGLGVMGIVFMGCGLYAYAHDRGHTVMVFALSACTGGLHWGGPISVANSTLEAALFLFYFVVSDHLGQALFLHFTLLFTGTSKLIAGRKWLILYVPAALAGVVSLGIIALPMASAASISLRHIFWLLIAFMVVYDLVVLATLVNRVVRPGQNGPLRKDLVVILGAFAIVALVSFLPTFGLTLAAGNDLLNFIYVLVPLAFAFVIVRNGKQRVSSHSNV
ncbi:MAG: hypothetical protein O7A63_09300 [Acidobacteria bacterium]|nr:hypothetical protein [Acidobacteriota bacterium]